MANRHLARTIAMQALFEWDFNSRQDDLAGILSRQLKESDLGSDDVDFATELAEGVAKNISAVDELIVKNAPEWPMEQIPPVDRNVLRLGLYELQFLKQVPPKVAINEAVELGKSFGGESSGKFVNGVLGTIYKQLFPEGEEAETNSKS